MRSLSLLDIKVQHIVEDDATVTAMALDASADTVYAISERSQGSKVQLSVYSLEKDSKDQVSSNPAIPSLVSTHRAAVTTIVSDAFFDILRRCSGYSYPKPVNSGHFFQILA